METGRDPDARAGAGGDLAISRRFFNHGLLAAGLTAAAGPLTLAPEVTGHDGFAFDYIVVGAGAGGGPVAARLAKAGHRVALLDAGLDPDNLGSRAVYEIPALLAAAAEHPLVSWDFYVKHYSDPTQQGRDPKAVPGKGVLYPRGSALGGSTAHNAMVFAYPHDQGWDDIADATGDDSWQARYMREYFQRLERCDYCQPNAPGHGFGGYLNTSRFDPQIFKLYPELRDLAEAGQTVPSSYFQGNTSLDLNHPLVALGDTGAFVTPMHVARQVRVSLREHLKAVQQEHPDRLFLIRGALATKVLMRGRQAVGVEFMRGVGLYEASKLYDPAMTPPSRRIYAKREVILAAGVFNTPQLLKLSGIGPASELERHGITVVHDLPGVGANLQDRYEVAVTVELKDPVEFYTRCLPSRAPDPCLIAWVTGLWKGATPPFFGPYANNTLFGSRIAKSRPGRSMPDLFLAGAPTGFHGYFPGFSSSSMQLGRSWTWGVLKAHTNNTAGTVTLRSTDPRRQPEINFRYFEEGNDVSGDDLEAVVEGIKLARSFLNHPQAAPHVASEISPGSHVQSDEALREYIRNEAWGHHASCSAKIGGDEDPTAVLDSRFAVRGIKRLRVVDACALPRVPGFFPVAAIMMLGEKAGDVILDESGRGRGSR